MRDVSKKKGRRSGFSVIEILAGTVILIILVVMVIDVLIRVKSASKTVACLSNLREISIAIEMYHSDYKMVPPSLSPALLPYLKAEVLKCPEDRSNEPDSYGRFYISRPLTDSKRLFLGCPRHAGGKAIGLFGWPQFNIGWAGKVLWNGSPVEQGVVVQGGTLDFEDGTRVVIDSSLRVGVMLSCTDPDNRLYSAICIQEGDQGSIAVNHPEGSDSQFEVLTPSLITGVAGTEFTITSYWPDPAALNSFSSTVTVNRGRVYIEERSTGERTYLDAPGSLTIGGIIETSPYASGKGKAPKPPRPPRKGWKKGHWPKEERD